MSRAAITSFLCVLFFTALVPLVVAEPGEEEKGFTPMFNGKDLTGWEGDPGLWSVEDGAITGTTTAEKPLKTASYLFWKGGQPGDFELRASFRFVSPKGNSGIQFRSQKLPKGDIRGYQADMETGPTHTGALYESNQRGIMTRKGQKWTIHENGRRETATFAKAGDLQKKIKANDWNEIAIIARGPEIVIKINGVIMCETIDREKGKAAAEGLIALQVHPGPPMKVQFKNFRIRSDKENGK